MRLYETMYILNPERNEEEIEALIERIKGIISKQGGEVVEDDRWGLKKMAYEIKKQRTGFYGLLKFKGQADVKNELERNFRFMDDVFRYLVLRLEE